MWLFFCRLVITVCASGLATCIVGYPVARWDQAALKAEIEKYTRMVETFSRPASRYAPKQFESDRGFALIEAEDRLSRAKEKLEVKKRAEGLSPKLGGAALAVALLFLLLSPGEEESSERKKATSVWKTEVAFPWKVVFGVAPVTAVLVWGLVLGLGSIKMVLIVGIAAAGALSTTAGMKKHAWEVRALVFRGELSGRPRVGVLQAPVIGSES